MITDPQQKIEQLIPGKEIGGNKRMHTTESSNFDKKTQTTTKEREMSIVTSTPNTGGWPVHQEHVILLNMNKITIFLWGKKTF